MQKMLPQTLDKAATAFPRFLHSYIVYIDAIFSIASCNETKNTKKMFTNESSDRLTKVVRQKKMH